MKKILCISDTHSKHYEWEKKYPIPDDIDIIIHAGDLTNIGLISEFNDFIYWLNSLYIKHKIIIAGNHDLGLDDDRRYNILDIIRGTNIHYLEDSGVTIEGINFWGSPVTPPFFDWAFMRKPDKIKNHWEIIPENTDVLITHGPAYGILDYVKNDNKFTGCKELLTNIYRIEPKYHIFGHIHNMYGIETRENTTHINASILNDYYKIVNSGHIIEI